MVVLTVTFALQEDTRAGGRAESSRQQYEISRNKRGGGNRTTHHTFLTQAWCSHARPCCLMRKHSKTTNIKQLTTYLLYVDMCMLDTCIDYSGHELIPHHVITNHA